jgi:hypothetical protein
MSQKKSKPRQSKKTEKVVREAVRKDASQFKHAPVQFKHDKNFVMFVFKEAMKQGSPEVAFRALKMADRATQKLLLFPVKRWLENYHVKLARMYNDWNMQVPVDSIRNRSELDEEKKRLRHEKRRLRRSRTISPVPRAAALPNWEERYRGDMVRTSTRQRRPTKKITYRHPGGEGAYESTATTNELKRNFDAIGAFK